MLAPLPRHEHGASHAPLAQRSVSGIAVPADLDPIASTVLATRSAAWPSDRQRAPCPTDKPHTTLI